MRKLDLYIIKKFLGTFFYAISLLIVIVIIFDISEKIDDFLEKQAPVSAILFSYYMNFIPYFINLFSYLFVFISVIFFTSKMAGNTEIVAILSSGISFRRFLRPYMIAATFLTIFSLFLSNFLIPHTNVGLYNFETNYLKDARKSKDMNIHMQIEPGTYIYVESFNSLSNVGQKFSLEKINKDQLTFRLLADRVHYQADKEAWQIDNYRIREIKNGKEHLRSGTKMDTLLNLKPADFTFNVEDVKVMDFMQLNAFIEQEKLKGSPNIKEYEVEKHKRIAFPFATIILTLIGVSISSRKVRGGIGMHLGMGITLTFTFILFMQVATVFATYGTLSPVIASWLPNIIFAFIAIFLVKKAQK